MARRYSWRVVSVVVVAASLSACASTQHNQQLFAAVDRDDGAAIEALIAQGVSPTTPDSRGVTPLGLAAFAGKMAAVAALLKAGIPVDSTDSTADGMTPLLAASLNGQMEVAKLLLASGADLLKADSKGRSALFLSAKHQELNDYLVSELHKKHRAKPGRSIRVSLAQNGRDLSPVNGSITLRPGPFTATFDIVGGTQNVVVIAMKKDCPELDVNNIPSLDEALGFSGNAMSSSPDELILKVWDCKDLSYQFWGQSPSASDFSKVTVDGEHMRATRDFTRVDVIGNKATEAYLVFATLEFADMAFQTPVAAARIKLSLSEK